MRFLLVLSVVGLLQGCAALIDRCADRARDVDPIIRDSYFNECVGANSRPMPVKVH